MTYRPTIQTGKLSVAILNNTHDQSTTTTTYIDYQITTGYDSVVDQFSNTLTIDATNNRVTLPAGKYYLDARLMIKRGAAGTWGAEYIWYSWDGSSRTDLGYVGREVGAVAIGDPHKSEHAKAYIESDGSAIIGLQYTTINGVLIEVSDTQYDDYCGQSRLMIWRFE